MFCKVYDTFDEALSSRGFKHLGNASQLLAEQIVEKLERYSDSTDFSDTEKLGNIYTQSNNRKSQEN